MYEKDRVDYAIEKVSRVSVLKMPRERAIKLLYYTNKLGKPTYFRGIDVNINEYGDLSILWERRGYELEITMNGSGPLRVYECINEEEKEYKISTIRSGAALIKQIWKRYTTEQLAFRRKVYE